MPRTSEGFNRCDLNSYFLIRRIVYNYARMNQCVKSIGFKTFENGFYEFCERNENEKRVPGVDVMSCIFHFLGEERVVTSVYSELVSNSDFFVDVLYERHF